MRKFLVSLLALMFVPAQAQDFSYRYGEAGYVKTDITLADGGGGLLAGSWLFSEHWLVFGSYSENSLRGGSKPSKADFEYLRGGFGYRARLPALINTDWYALLSYNRIDLTEFEDEPESGEDFELGLRHQWRPNIEVNAAARYYYSNIECIDLLAGEAGFKLGGLWRVTDKRGLSFSYEDIDRFSEWRIALRQEW